MASHGAALQTQNNELVKCIEELKEKREMLIRSIREDEAEKAKIQQDLQVSFHEGPFCDSNAIKIRPSRFVELLCRL